MESEPTRIMIAVNESSIKGYPHPSISSKRAFEWTLQKIVRSNTSGFKLLFLHVQVPDEDGLEIGLSSGIRHRIKILPHNTSDDGSLENNLTVIKQITGFDDMDSIYASPDDFKDLERREKARGLQLLEYFVKTSHEVGVRCGAWIKKGDPKEVICHEVKRIQPDLLVVGCRGLGPFQRVFVGTVSEFCVKHAECPVITIKRRPDETPQDPVDD